MISIELVPRSEASLKAELSTLATAFPGVSMVNIPDLLRFELRSWQACAMAIGGLERAVPHIRAMDFSLNDAPRLSDTLRELGLREALIVRGDPPQDLARPVYPTTSQELIGALKQQDPSLTLYAALDPYRASLRDELTSAKQKLEAGARGFFTQPFFDIQLMTVYADLLRDADVFWGVSPVVTEKSRRYWEVKNRAVFPRTFETTLAWNREHAAACLEFARQRQASVYFMPIRVDLVEYLVGLL